MVTDGPCTIYTVFIMPGLAACFFESTVPYLAKQRGLAHCYQHNGRDYTVCSYSQKQPPVTD